jgi:hypothetical protein
VEFGRTIPGSDAYGLWLCPKVLNQKIAERATGREAECSPSVSGEPKLEVGNEGDVDEEVVVPELDRVAALGSEAWSGKGNPS